MDCLPFIPSTDNWEFKLGEILKYLSPTNTRMELRKIALAIKNKLKSFASFHLTIDIAFLRLKRFIRIRSSKILCKFFIQMEHALINSLLQIFRLSLQRSVASNTNLLACHNSTHSRTNRHPLWNLT